MGNRGDVNIDSNINVIDCSYVLTVVQELGNKSVSYINQNYPNILPCGPNAALADTDHDLHVNISDVQNILDFYSYVAIGHTKEDAFNYLSVHEGNYCYEAYPIII